MGTEVMLSARVDADLRKRVKQVAVSQDVTIAKFVEAALELHIERLMKSHASSI
jgi:hypothetical protein